MNKHISVLLFVCLAACVHSGMAQDGHTNCCGITMDSAPADESYECLDNVPEASSDDVTATDACGNDLGVSLTESTDGSDCNMTITRTWTATDEECDETQSVTQTITVQDTTPPEVLAPANATYECLDDVPEADDEVDATDNCDGNITAYLYQDADDGNTCPKTITRIWKATDSCDNEGSGTQTITVLDVTEPLVDAPADATYECLDDVPEADDEVDATDNCDGNITAYLYQDADDGNTCPKTITRIWKAIDACGNEGSGIQTITVLDVTDPLVDAPADATYECLDDVPDAADEVDATDNCDGNLTAYLYQDVTNGTCPTTITRIWKAIDACGNEGSGIQTITVLDVTDPLVDAPADATYECLDEVPDAADEVDATDNCDGNITAYLDQDTDDGNTCPTTITRIWKAVDACGNEGTGTQTITVMDYTYPFIECPHDQEVEADDNGEGYLPDFTSTPATDNCDEDVEVTQSPAANDGPYDIDDVITVTLTATDDCGNSMDCSFDVTIVCGSGCSGGVCTFGGGGGGNDSVNVKINLGQMEAGRSAGNLTLYAKTPSHDLGTPAALRFYPRPGGPEVIRSAAGALRQIRPVQGLADIVPLDDYRYEMRFYAAENAGSKNSQGLYQPTGDPFVVWRVEAFSNDVNQLVVYEIRGSVTNQFDYLYSDEDLGWSLTTGGGLKEEIRASVWDANGMFRTETHVIADGDGNEALREINVYKAVPWGEAKIQTIVDPEGEALTTTRTFYEDPQQTGKYRRLASEQHPDGSIAAFDYNTVGRTVLESHGWKDVPAGSNGARTVSSSYVPVDPNDDGATWPHKPRTVTTEADGVVVSKTYYAYYGSSKGEITKIQEDCASPNAAYGDAGNLRTITVYHSQISRLWPGKVKSIQYPDGRLDRHEYERGTYVPNGTEPGTFVPGTGDYSRVTVIHGTTSATNGISEKTTREVAVRDPVGNEVLNETYVYSIPNPLRMDWTVNTYNDLGQLTASYYANGTSKSTDWGTGCCGRESDTFADGTTILYGYDALSRVSSRTKAGMAATGSYPAQPDIVTSYVLDAMGRTLQETTAADGLALVRSNQYDLAGRLVKSVDSAGLETLYAYDQGGRITTITHPGGATEITEKYLDGRVKSVTGAGVVPRFYEYGVETNGCQWTLVHTGSSNSLLWEKTTTDMLGRTIRIEKPGFGGTLLTTIQEYNNLGQLVATRQWQGDPPSTLTQPPTLYEYDELGRVFRTALDVDNDGAISLDSPDRINEIATQFVWASGHWWETVVTTIYAGEGSAIPTTVNTQWRKISGSGCGCSARVGKTVDAYGNPTITTEEQDPVTKTVTTTQNVPYSDADAVSITVNGLLQSRTTPTGLTTTYAYDALGRTIATTDPRTGTSTIHYNAAGQVDWTEDAAGNRTTYAYDPATGRRIAVTDALTNTVYTAYDVQGRVTNTWGAAYPVAYEYDAYGRMAAMKTWRDTNGAPDVTRWNYDEASGLLTNKVYADGFGPSYEYDSAGRLTKRTWARGVETEYTYDFSGQLTEIDYSDATPDVTFTHDRLGRQKTITDALGTRTNVYDALTLLDERMADGTVLARSYDLLGRPSGIALDADYAIGYGYDEFGRFAAVAVSNGVQFDYSYVPDSDLLSGWSVSDGAATAYAYEPNRNLRTEVVNTFDGSPVSAFAYAYDAAGRRTQRVDSGLTTNLFGYNMKSELADAIMGTNVYAYLYDPIGNRQLASANEVTNLYQANELNQYTNINAGVVEPIYDPDGNMTQLGPWAYDWDGENRLISVASNGVPVVQNQYDYMSRRIMKATATQTNTFLYDGWNLIREDLGAAAPSSRSYVWGLDLSGTLQGAGGVGGLLAMLSPDSCLQTPAYDANGNITDLVDTNGAVVAHYEYDPYGNTIAQSGDYADLNPLRFSSKYWDGETEFYYYGYRFYSPGLGRWINRDPIEEMGGVNLFAAMRNDAIRFIDYLGHETKCCTEWTPRWKLEEYGEVVDCFVARLKAIDPVLYAQLQTGGFTWETVISAAMCIGGATGGGNKIAKCTTYGSLFYLLYNSFSAINSVFDAYDWCKKEKCTQFVAKEKKPWYKWPLFKCEVCPDGSDEVKVDDNNDAWRKPE